MVEMLLAPELHIVVTRYGIRILPQVQIEFPFLRRGERPVENFNLERDFPCPDTLGLHGQPALVMPGRRILRDFYCNPYRLQCIIFQVYVFAIVHHVGHHQRVELADRPFSALTE